MSKSPKIVQNQIGLPKTISFSFDQIDQFDMKQQFKIEQNENAQILIVDDNIFNLSSLQ
jgi:hypothetical protein